MTGELQKTDVAIIGAGPIGLFTIFQCGMLKMQCHVFDALDMLGGQCTALYPEKPIFDIPAHPRIHAAELIDRLAEQASPFNPVYHLASQVRKLEKLPDGRFLIESELGKRVEAGAVVIAAGAGAFGPNRPPLAGLEEYEGKSVFYLIRRREDFRGKKVVIAGGGDSAVDWALSLVDIAERVMVVHRRNKFRAAPANVAHLEGLSETGRLDLVIPYQLHGLDGQDGQLRQVSVADLEGNIRHLEADAMLAFFGLSTDPGPFEHWGLKVERHHLVVDPATFATSVPGIFAVGDITAYPGKLKLILSGFAEAAAAAHSAFRHIHPGEALHFEYSTTKGPPSTI